MLRRAIEIGATDDAKESAQAISFLREAVDIAPGFADAWAALALAYSYSFATSPLEQHPAIFERAKDAANRALAIDAGNADALAALIANALRSRFNLVRRARENRHRRARLRQPRLRERSAYCCGDPVNRFDPDGHWSFGGVLLSLLGVLWTLPNTAFGLAVEISCLIGEVVRWLVYAVTIGHVSWQTPGFDVAASGRLNAFALVFKGGWLGSFDSLLGITFGNVIFVNGEYEQHKAFQALPDPVSPPAYGGIETIPKAQALYEHELRHVNQYSWWGPFFHLGLPLFGLYRAERLAALTFQVPRVLTAWTTIMAALIAVLFAMKLTDEVSRLWILLCRLACLDL